MIVFGAFLGSFFLRFPLPANPRPHAHFLKRLQNIGPTATGLGASDRARSVDILSPAEIAVRDENVGFTAETLLL